MSYKDKRWDEYECSYLKTFGKDVEVYTPSVYREHRGEIWTTLQTKTHPMFPIFQDEDYTIHDRFSQSYKGVLRGLHYDDKTWKLVQSVVGDIYLVVLDINEWSPTYGKWESYILSDKTRDQVLIPPGFANGHYALTDCVFHYNMMYKGDYVDVDNQGVIKWNDERFNIEWPTDNPIMSERDK